MSLPISIKLPEGFLQSEVRDGYLVSEKQKIWAVELDLLDYTEGFNPFGPVSFVKRFRAEVSADKPIVVVPSTYAQETESELAAIGVNIVIYANQLFRAAYPAMRKCAERILECERAQEASAELCMPIKEIISLI